MAIKRLKRKASSAQRAVPRGRVASVFSEEDYLREKARALNAGLSARLSEYVDELPAGQSSHLIDILKAFTQKIDEELSVTAHMRFLRYFCLLIDNLSQTLDWLDHAHTAKTPRGFVQLLNKLSEVLYQGAPVLVTPDSEYNYRINNVVKLFSVFAEALSPSAQKQLIAQLPPALYRVRFPRIERENILNHALFGHEFGHPIADEFFDKHEKEKEYQTHLQEARRKIQEEEDIADELEDCQDPAERLQLLSQYSDEISKIHMRALQEIVSDAVAVYLFGLSALFSAYDFFVQNSIDELPAREEYYPPTRYRWRTMLHLLKEGGHVDSLKKLPIKSEQKTIKSAALKLIDHIESIVEQQDDREVLTASPAVRIAYEWLPKTLPVALAYVRDRVGPAIFDSDLIQKEIPGLLDQVCLHVPPSEIGIWPKLKPVDWRSSILASWLVALKQMTDKSLASNERHLALLTTQRLALKAVEYVLLQTEHSNFESQRRVAT